MSDESDGSENAMAMTRVGLDAKLQMVVVVLGWPNVWRDVASFIIHTWTPFGRRVVTLCPPVILMLCTHVIYDWFDK